MNNPAVTGAEVFEILFNDHDDATSAEQAMTEPLFDVEPAIKKSAIISPCGTYRYELIRRWADGPLLEWAMLNPSTADANEDDPTIRRCIGFAQNWGLAGIRVTNVFAYRATDPKELLNPAIDPNGPDNHEYLRAEHGPITVVAWGAHDAIRKRSKAIDHIFSRSCLMCLGYNADGSPKHPLYVPASRGLAPWPKPDPTERNY